MPEFEKIIIVTRKTALEELQERFNTREQAMFYLRQHVRQRKMSVAANSARYSILEQEEQDVEEVTSADMTYHDALAAVKDAVPEGVRVQHIDRSFLPTFTFGEKDLVVTIGQDGLVVNTAKYLNGQPLVAFNPDPATIDGVLIPFSVEHANYILNGAVRGHLRVSPVTMAKAELNDGQAIYAVNDLFIGAQSHVSARYRITFGEVSEEHSSSGIIVSTGAGSTGWFRSILTGAVEIAAAFSGNTEILPCREDYRFDREAEQLCFSVREPFVSKTSSARLVFGRIGPGETLDLASQMPQGGVIFSDGIESDYLQFNSGASATIGLADRKLNLVTE